MTNAERTEIERRNHEAYENSRRDYLNEAGRMKKRRTLLIPEREHIDQLVDLIREAHNALTHPESRVDLRDWVQSAERVLKA